MFLSIRIDVPDDQVDHLEIVFFEKIKETLQTYGLLTPQETAYHNAEAFGKIVTIYQTPAESAYVETLQEIAEESEGDENLIDEALQTLKQEAIDYHNWPNKEDL